MNEVKAESIKLLVVDENNLFSSTLKILLKDFNIDVVAQADNEETMLKQLKKHQPTILIYDLFMSSSSCLLSFLSQQTLRL